MRINKQINDLNIVNEIKSETKDLYEQSYSNNNYSYNNDINNKDENNKKILEIFGIMGKIAKKNAIINDFWKYKYNNDIKNKNKTNNKYKEDSNENQESEEDDNNNDIIYDKPEKYNKIEIIFCDDLNE